MAKKRVNTRFLVIMTAVVVLALVAVVAIGLKNRRGEGYYVAKAQAAEKAAQGKEGAEKFALLEEAARNYGGAFGASHPRNVEYLLKQGDTYLAAASIEPDPMNRFMASWRAALEQDPTNVGALRRVLQQYAAVFEGGPRQAPPAVYSGLLDYATRLRAADPSDAEAEALVHAAPVLGYLGKQATDKRQLEKELAALEVIAKDKGLAGKYLSAVAQARLQLSEEARSNRDSAEADRQRDAAVGLLDQAVKRRPDDAELRLTVASMQFRLGKGMHAVAEQLRKQGMASAVAEADKAEERSKALTASAKENLAAGKAAIKPDDANNARLRMIAAALDDESGDAKAADEAWKKLLADKPDDLIVRLQYAQFLKRTPEGKARAIELLSSKPIETKNRNLELMVLGELTGLRMDALAEQQAGGAAAATRPGAGPDRAAELAAIEEGVQRLTDAKGNDPAVMKLRARLLQLQGKTVEAIQVLEKADATAQGASLEIKLTLAQSYLMLQPQQTGQAKKLLNEVVQRAGSYAPARMLLAQLLLQENDTAGAEAQVQALEQMDAGNPDVVRLRMQLQVAGGGDAGKAEAKALYAKLPEGTFREQLVKAQTAARLGDDAEVVRLLEAARKGNPGDLTVLGSLLQLYVKGNQKDRALKLVDEAIAIHPDNAMLKAVKQQLEAKTPQEAQQIGQQALVEGQKDEFGRELAQYGLAAREGKRDEAMKHLDRAEQLKPDEPSVLELRFQNGLIEGKTTGKWEAAKKYADRIAATNADGQGGVVARQRLAMTQGDHAQSIALAQQILDKTPQLSQSYEILGRALASAGRYSEAVTRLQQALEKQTENMGAMQVLVGCYYELDQPAEAQKWIMTGRKMQPNNPAFRELEVQHSLRHGDGTLAVAAREEDAKADPENKDRQIQLASAYLRAAQSALGQGTDAGNAKAKPYLEKLAKLIADGQQKWPGEMSFFGLRIELASATNDFAAGQAALNQLMTTPGARDNPQTYAVAADFLARFNKLPEAEGMMIEAVGKSGSDPAYVLKLAQLQRQAGRFDEALKTLDPLVKQDVEVAQRRRIEVLGAAGKIAEAEEALAAMIAKRPEAYELQTQLIRVLMAQGGAERMKKAAAMADAILAKQPNEAGALYLRAVMRLQQQPKPDLDGAMKDLQAIKDRNPSNVEVRFLLADIYSRRKDPDRAVRELEGALSADPSNKAVRQRLIEFHTRSAPPRWSEVERLVKDAMANPQTKDDAAWPMALGEMWLARGQAGEAVNAYQAAVKLDPGNADVVRRYFDALLRVGQFDRLIKETDPIAQKGSQPSWFHANRAVAYGKLKRADLAKAEINKMLDAPDALASEASINNIAIAAVGSGALDAALQRAQERAQAGDASWQMVTAFLLTQKGDVGGAISTAEKVLAVTGDKGLNGRQKEFLLRYLAGLYLQTSPPQYNKAVAATRQLVELAPGDMSALNNLACFLVDYVNPPQPDEAVKYAKQAYDEAMKSGEPQPLVLDTYGWTLVCAGQVDEGITWLRRVVDDKPFIDAHYHLAEAYLKKSKPAEAQRQLSQASSLLDEMKRKKEAFDPGLPDRIAGATERAKQMLKAQAGATP